MQRNIKGYISLLSALGSIAFICLALCVLSAPISGTTLALHGSVNMGFAITALVLGVVASISGILAVRDRDKQGPRKAGLIIGVIAIIISLGSMLIVSFSKMIVDYANDVPGNSISQMDGESRKSIDEALSKLREEYPEK